MKRALLFLAAVLAGCSPSSEKGQVLSHVPVSVGNVTYQWPFDNSPDLGDPKEWKGFAIISNRVWNETIGIIPNLRAKSGSKSIWLTPAKATKWSIDENGNDLPLNAGEHFSLLNKQGALTFGLIKGEGIVSPSTAIVFKGEPNAYATCRPPSGSNSSGTCIVMVNDRGVQHTLNFPWGEWNSVPAMLSIYRKLIGVPKTN